MNEATSTMEGVKPTVQDEPGRLVKLASRDTVAPGETAQIHHKAGGTLTIFDVSSEASSEIVSIRAGNQTFNRGADETWRDVLARGQAVPPGAYLIALVRNTAEDRRAVGLTLRISETSVVMPASAASGGVSPVRGIPTPRAAQQHAPSIASSSPWIPGRASGAIVGGAGSSNGAPLAASSAGTPTVRHEVPGGLDMVLPNEGERAVLMVKGFTFGLIRWLEHGAPVRDTYRSTLVSQLLAAQHREGAIGVTAGSVEFVVLLTSSQITALIGCLRKTRGPLSADEKPLLLKALKKAVERDVALSRARNGGPGASTTALVAADAAEARP